jgi:hypothetical protein
MLNDPLLTQTGVDRDIRDLASIHFADEIEGNPFPRLRRFVNADTATGRRVLSRLSELAEQFDDRERDPQAQQ